MLDLLLPPVEAGGVILEKVAEILSSKAAGNRLEALLKTHSARRNTELGR